MRFSALASLTTLLVAPVLSAPTDNTPKRGFASVEAAAEVGIELDANVGIDVDADVGLGIGLGLDVDADVDVGLGLGIDLGLDLEIEIGLDLEIGVEVAADIDVKVAAEVEVEVNVDASIDYTLDSGVDYPQDISENPENYAEPLGGWDSIMHPLGSDKGKQQYSQGYTSTYAVIADGSEVVNGSDSAPESSDARGLFYYVINSDIDTICWKIVLFNVVGGYKSSARTATHIHEAAFGESGPARIALPNPVGDNKRRISKGCMTGPFKTGVKVNGRDTGAGFSLSQIEEDPANFFTDCHTKKFSLGVVRGQLAY